MISPSLPPRSTGGEALLQLFTVPQPHLCGCRKGGLPEGGGKGSTLTYGAQELARWSKRERQLKRKVASKRPRPPWRSFVFFSLFLPSFSLSSRERRDVCRKLQRRCVCVGVRGRCELGRGCSLKGGTAILSSGFLEMSETNWSELTGDEDGVAYAFPF